MPHPLFRDLIKTQSRQVDFGEVLTNYWACRRESQIPPQPGLFLRLTREELGNAHRDLTTEAPTFSLVDKPSSGIKAWYEQTLAEHPGFLWLMPPIFSLLVDKADTSPRLAKICDVYIRLVQKTIPWISPKVKPASQAVLNELNEVFPKTLHELKDPAKQEALVTLVSNPLKHWPELNPFGDNRGVLERTAHGWINI